LDIEATSTTHSRVHRDCVGANIKAVQRMLGHATATMTLDKYGHLYDDDLTAPATAVSRSRAYALRTGAGNRTVVPLRNLR